MDFGGNSTAGQYKNEDGCLVWFGEKEDWEFAILLDAHNSAELIVEVFTKKKEEVLNQFSLPPKEMIKNLNDLVLSIFQDDEFLARCRKTKGETACLVVARMDKYIWWLSVGDCLLYLFHQELTALGQYQLNQRQFYEWIGQVNTFEQPVPCYSSGTKELRKGINHILLTTDGLVECPEEPYTNPSDISKVFLNTTNEEGVRLLLQKIEESNVRDSTTIVSWIVGVSKEASKPSNQ